jgi:20S proteasome subunit beta 4
MEYLLGIKCKDFVLMACDTVAAHSIVAMKKDHEKMMKLGDQLVMSIYCSNGGGDDIQFAEYIAKNIQLYRMRNGYNLSTKEAATFTRRNLADALRSSTPYSVSLFIGGYDQTEGPSLYYMDYLATSVKVPFGVHGYGSFFTLSCLDRYYKEDMSQDEAVTLLQRCINELSTRFIVSWPVFKVKVIDQKGVHDLPEMKPTPAADTTDNVMYT